MTPQARMPEVSCKTNITTNNSAFKAAAYYTDVKL
jgi:hypothetical protein